MSVSPNDLGSGNPPSDHLVGKEEVANAEDPSVSGQVDVSRIRSLPESPLSGVQRISFRSSRGFVFGVSGVGATWYGANL